MIKYKKLTIIGPLLLLVFLAWPGCHPTLREAAQTPAEAMRPVHYLLPDFQDDGAFSALAQAIENNLLYLRKLDPERTFFYGPHEYPCRHVIKSQKAFLELISKNPDAKTLKKAIRENFRVYRASGRQGNRHVLFTGYFEPIYDARLSPQDAFQHPLYKKPDDLIKIDLSPFRSDLKGKSITARITKNRVVPYFSRSEIEMKKVLKGKNLEIAWLKDPVDVAFLHIQGSGRLRLADGSTISVGYRASNGRPYMSIGRYMIDKGYLTREEVSMQSIRKYLSEHPHVMIEVLNHNPSYIFFTRKPNGPFGNINVPLTPGRSIALDTGLFPKGALCFIATKKPNMNKTEDRITGWTDFSRFVLNQDTGGAIKGAGRADIFWGSGAYAELTAGHMKHEGELYVLILKREKP